MSGITTMGMLQNKSFLVYSIINPLDMMIAHLAKEHVSVFPITIGFVGEALSGVEMTPIKLSDAIFGLLSAVLLGVSCAVISSESQ